MRRIDTVGDSHLTIGIEKGPPILFHSGQVQRSLHDLEANGQIVPSPAQEETGTCLGFAHSGLMTGEQVAGHVVSGVGAVYKCLSRELTGVLAHPWAAPTRRLAECTWTTFDRDDLVLRTSAARTAHDSCRNGFSRHGGTGLCHWSFDVCRLAHCLCTGLLTYTRYRSWLNRPS